MFIDFAKAEALPEGVTAELLASPEIQKYIETQFDENYQTRSESEFGGLKRNTEALKEEKRVLQGHLDGFKGVDIEEYTSLKEFKANNGEAGGQIERATVERDAAFAARDAAIAERDEIAQTSAKQIQSRDLRDALRDGIRGHNAKFPAVGVAPSSERWILEEASDVFQQDDNGKFVPVIDGRVQTNPDGSVMAPEDWVNSLRGNPEFESFFDKPAGGGATGKGGLGGAHFNPKNLGGSVDERKGAIGARFPELGK